MDEARVAAVDTRHERTQQQHRHPQDGARGGQLEGGGLAGDGLLSGRPEGRG
jgi:hypothetical protein